MNVNMKFKRRLIALIALLISAYTLFLYSKSRNSQFFGAILSSVKTNDKLVALTFDDGPNSLYTDSILAILDSADIKATFYLVGKEIGSHPEELRKIISHGHEIGNHSYSHTRMILKSYGFIEDEIEHTNSLIRKSGYSAEITFRPPYGKKLFLLPYILMRKKIRTIMWNIEPDSIDSLASDAGRMTKYVEQTIEPGSILLMHVWPETRTHSRAALLPIIQALKEKQYKFVTVSQLLSADRK